MFTSNPSGPGALFFLRDLNASSNSFSVRIFHSMLHSLLVYKIQN